MFKKLNVNVGDKVIVSSRFGGEKIGTIEKITPKGFIKVNGILFTDCGRERGGDAWSCSYIKPATLEQIEQLNQKKYRRYVLNKLHSLQDIDYEKAVRIDEILNEIGGE